MGSQTLKILEPLANVGFAGRTVVLFESRRSEALARSVRDFGGTPLCAPSVAEVPLGDSAELAAFGQAVIDGKIDSLICMTGFGVRLLIETLSAQFEQEELLAALRRITLVTRGLKPAQALRDYAIAATVVVPEPATWEEIVETLRFSERSLPLDGRAVALLESGARNEPLEKALRALGARVSSVSLYRWALPKDLAPLQEAIARILRAEGDLLVFTNAVQVRHLFQVLAQNGQADAFRKASRQAIVASVGPLTSRALTDHGLRVDFEAQHPRMSALIVELAGQAGKLAAGVARPGSQSASAAKPALPAVSPASPARKQSPFLAACRREPVPHTPVWLMRQAGRYMKSYRDLRGKVPFIDLCKNPELATQVTVEAAKQLGVDAAILFSDLLLIVEPMGLGLEYASGEGPIITGRVESQADVDRLREIDVRESLGYVFDAVALIRRALPDSLPLIGFGAAPFTLAAYMIEGGSSRQFTDTKRFLWNDPGAWHALMEKISRALTAYLNAQIDAGADAIQIFDSWVGCLSPADYRAHVLPHTRAIIRGLKPGVPVIHFGTGSAALLPDMRDAGGDVIGVDFRVDLDAAWKMLGDRVGIQGNLDPAALHASPDVIRSHVRRVFDQAANRPGHIFNLGHGVLPDTPEDHARALVDMVHALSRR